MRERERVKERGGAVEGRGVRVTWPALLPLLHRSLIPLPATIKVLLLYLNMLLLN